MTSKTEPNLSAAPMNVHAVTGTAGRLRVSIVILTYSRDEVLAELLGELHGMIGERSDCEVILVDNNIDQVQRSEMLKAFPAWQYVRSGQNKGVIARNDGMEVARGDVIALLDDDVFIQTREFPDILTRLFDADPALGCITIRKLDKSTMSTRSESIPHTRKSVDLTKPFLTFRFSGGLVAFRRSVNDALGGFSPEFFYGLEEIEYSYRIIKAGWKILYDPEIVALELQHPAGRRPKIEVQTLRLTNKYIISYLHMPFPQVGLNLVLFTLYVLKKQWGEIDVGKAIKDFAAWLKRPDRPRRAPIDGRTAAYIRACGGDTWR